MARIDELRLLTKVARLYYEQDMTQPEIAVQLDLSQATVSRLLKRAKQERIIRITVNVPFGTYPELEENLQKTYGLKEAVVVDSVEDNDQVLRVLGGLGSPSAGVYASRLIGRLANLVHGEAVLLPAPGIVGSPDAVPILLQDRYVHQAMDLFEQVTLALVGIGSVEPSGLLASSGNIFSPEELSMLREAGAVGDICLRFFDRTGTPVLTPLNNRVIGMELAQLRTVKRAVGIAGGSRKLNAIRGALIGRLINVLITDRFTAEKLLQDIQTIDGQVVPASFVA
jgi:DNA-binding transcriptional regulator LsrR (DeoR family)